MIVPMVVLPPGTAERIQRARLLASISSRKLARLANVAEGFVAQIERGQAKSPAFGAIDSIARVLGVSLDWLAGHGKEPSEKEIRAAVKRAEASQPAAEVAA